MDYSWPAGLPVSLQFPGRGRDRPIGANGICDRYFPGRKRLIQGFDSHSRAHYGIFVSDEGKSIRVAWLGPFPRRHITTKTFMTVSGYHLGFDVYSAPALERSGQARGQHTEIIHTFGRVP